MTTALRDLQYMIREINMFIEVWGTQFSWYFFCLYIQLFLNLSFKKNKKSFCQCTEGVSSICTLYELGRSLAGLKNKKHYEELNLGPLCKLPLIHRMFKIDSNTKDDDIYQIETVDILKVSLASPKTVFQITITRTICNSVSHRILYSVLFFLTDLFQIRKKTSGYKKDGMLKILDE